jgi:hypothetical protein
VTLLWLVVGHFVADFPLQTDWIAKFKNRHNASSPPPGQSQQTPWPWIMTAHAATHAAAVLAITGSPWKCAAEFVCHWLMDFAKCEGAWNLHIDQCLHLTCKLVWWLFP